MARNLNSIMSGLFGHGAGTALDTVSGVEGMQGPTRGTGISGAVSAAAGGTNPLGGDLAQIAPMLQGLLGNMEESTAVPSSRPTSLGTSVSRGGGINPVNLPQVNPASLMRR